MLQAGGRDMETWRLPLELDHAPVLAAQVEQNFSEHVLQLLVADLRRLAVMVEVRVRNVERRAELMGGGVGGVAVDATQPLDRVRCAQHACDAELVAFGSESAQRVGEVPADGLQKRSRFRHEIRHGVGQRVEVIPAAGLDSDQRAARIVGVGDACDRRDADALSGCILVSVGVVENLVETPDAVVAAELGGFRSLVCGGVG